MNGRRQTIRRQIQIPQKPIRQRLTEISPIQLQRHKHDARPHHDAPVNLADETMFFAPCPAREGVEAVDVFPYTSQVSIHQSKVRNRDGEDWKKQRQENKEEKETYQSGLG